MYMYNVNYKPLGFLIYVRLINLKKNKPILKLNLNYTTLYYSVSIVTIYRFSVDVRSSH